VKHGRNPHPEVAYNHLEQAELLGFASILHHFFHVRIISLGEFIIFPIFFGSISIIFHQVHHEIWQIYHQIHSSSTSHPPNFQDFPSNPASNPPNLSTSHVHSRLKEDIWDVLPEIQDVATAKVAVKQALAPLQEAGLCGFSSSINGISWDIIHGIYSMDISMIMGKSSIYP
jgi:hypothetical protein